MPHRDLFDLKPDEMTTMLAEAETQPNGGAGTGGVNPFPMIYGTVESSQSQNSVTAASSSNTNRQHSSNSPPKLSTEVIKIEKKIKNSYCFSTIFTTFVGTDEKVKRYIAMLQQKSSNDNSTENNNM